MDYLEQVEKDREFLDDCVALTEALRCLGEKGVENIDTECVTLKEEVFERLFPGIEWEPVIMDGEQVTLLWKQAQYRGFMFDCLRAADG